MKYDFEPLVNKLLSQHKRQKGELGDYMKLSRQGLKDKLRANRFDMDQIDSMASFFQLTSKEFLGMATVGGHEVSSNDYLTKYVAELEDRIHCQEEENRHLRETIRELLGKSDDVPHDQHRRRSTALKMMAVRV